MPQKRNRVALNDVDQGERTLELRRFTSQAHNVRMECADYKGNDPIQAWPAGPPTCSTN